MKKFILLLVVLLLLNAFIVSAEENDLDVKIATDELHINGTKIDNSKEAYPFIVYKDITYFPLTWDYARAMGLDSSWTPESGLVIKKAEKSEGVKLSPTSVNDATRTYKASLASSAIQVNGSKISNAKEDYPLLLFRDITYFPMTWRFMVDEFGAKYQWTKESGLAIDVSFDTPVNTPVSIESVPQIIETSSFKDLFAKNFSSTYFVVGLKEPAEYTYNYGVTGARNLFNWVTNKDYEQFNTLLINNDDHAFGLYGPVESALETLLPELYALDKNGIYFLEFNNRKLVYIRCDKDEYKKYIDYLYTDQISDVTAYSIDYKRSLDGSETVLVDNEPFENASASRAKLSLEELLANNPTLEADGQTKAVYFEADPEKGFNFPYVIFIPSDNYKDENLNNKKYLLLEGHNFGGVSNDMDVHIYNALTSGLNSHVATLVQERLHIPRMMPIVPKFSFKNTANMPEYAHNHALDSTVMFIEDNIDHMESLDADGYLSKADMMKLYDIEKQIHAMVLDAQANLRQAGYVLEDKIFTAGFSGAGNFSSRYTSIYPETVKAMYSGGMFIPFVPGDTYDGQKLIYQIGSYDHDYLFGRPFDLEAYNNVAKIMYLGGKDSHDALLGTDTFTKQQRELAMKLYGYDVKSRWQNAQKVFYELGGQGQFITNINARHNAGNSDLNHVVEFFKNNSNSVNPVYEHTTSYNDLIIINNLEEAKKNISSDSVESFDDVDFEVIGKRLDEIKVPKSTDYQVENAYELEFVGKTSEKAGDKWYKVETKYANVYFYDEAIRLSYIKNDVDDMIEHILDFHEKTWDGKKAKLYFLDEKEELKGDRNYRGSGFNHTTEAITFSADMVNIQGNNYEDPRATVLHELAHWIEIPPNFDSDGGWFEESMAYYLAYNFEYKKIDPKVYPDETQRVIFDFFESKGEYNLKVMMDSYSVIGKIKDTDPMLVYTDLRTLENLNHNSYRLACVQNGRILEASAIEYLVNVYGKDKILEVYKKIHQGSYNFKDVFEGVYDKSLAEMSAEWRKYTGLDEYFVQPN